MSQSLPQDQRHLGESPPGNAAPNSNLSWLRQDLPPRTVPTLDYATARRNPVGMPHRIPAYVWISAGLAELPWIVLVVALGIAMDSPVDQNNFIAVLFAPIGRFLAIVAMNVAACVCLFLFGMEHCSLRGRSIPVTGLVVVFLGLSICVVIYLMQASPSPFTDPTLPMGLIAIDLLAMAGHVVWLLRLIKVDIP